MDIFTSLANSPSLPLLFCVSFLASTLLPIGSEWLLIAMILQGFSSPELVITATFGNFLGACTSYVIGIWGSDFFIRSILRISDSQLGKAKNLYLKYGTWSLLLSWLPVVGDPLCVLGGIFRVNFLRFSLLVFIGKFLRYAILALLAHYGTGG